MGCFWLFAVDYEQSCWIRTELNEPIWDYTKLAQRLERTFIRVWRRFFPASEVAGNDRASADLMKCMRRLGALDKRIQAIYEPVGVVLFYFCYYYFLIPSSYPVSVLKIRTKRRRGQCQSQRRRQTDQNRSLIAVFFVLGSGRIGGWGRRPNESQWWIHRLKYG